MLNFSDLKLDEYQKDNFVDKLLELFEEKSKIIPIRLLGCFARLDYAVPLFRVIHR